MKHWNRKLKFLDFVSTSIWKSLNEKLKKLRQNKFKINAIYKLVSFEINRSLKFQKEVF